MANHNLIGLESMLRSTQDTYSDLGYQSEPFPYTTASFLEAHARLFGLTVASAKTAKVLELGGSYGGNIITQAFLNQEAHYTVVDLSQMQIEGGQAIVDELGLKNIKLVHKNIMDLDESFGKFDYIIAHGLYSWVDDQVKDRILDTIRDLLEDHGVAYLSYNTYPGWHTMDEVRQLMLFANRPHPEAPQRDQVQRAKYVASMIGTKIMQYDDLKARNKKFLGALRKVVGQADYYVGHDHLEIHNDPFYFQEIADRWEAKGLTYVCDSDLTLSFVDALDKELALSLAKLAPNDRIGQEQYLDFLLDTSFRKSILVKASQDHKKILSKHRGISSITAEVLEQFHFRILEGESILDTIPHAPIREAYQYFMGKEDTFTFDDMLERIPLAYREDLVTIMATHMIEGRLVFSCHPSKLVAYQSNRVYVPTETTNFVAALILGAGQGRVVLGTHDNEAAPYINSIDLEIMSILNEPKPEADILAAMEGMPIYDTSQDDYHELSPEEYLPIGLSHIERLGFFKKK